MLLISVVELPNEHCVGECMFHNMTFLDAAAENDVPDLIERAYNWIVEKILDGPKEAPSTEVRDIKAIRAFIMEALAYPMQAYVRHNDPDNGPADPKIEEWHPREANECAFEGRISELIKKAVDDPTDALGEYLYTSGLFEDQEEAYDVICDWFNGRDYIVQMQGA